MGALMKNRELRGEPAVGRRILNARRAVLLALVFVVAMSVAAMATASPARIEVGSAPKGNFEAASGCGCHSTFVEQWSKSMHAQALTDPLYQTKLAEAQKATNGAIGQFCENCHGPAATMLGEIGKADMSAGAADAVGCSFCHAVVGIEGDVANTSHLVQPDGVRRAQIKDPKAPHKAAYSAFHETAEFCGGCHNVNHPGNGLAIEATYTEWKQSPWAKEGVKCQDCHMSTAPGVIGPSKGRAAGGAPERDNIYQMIFVGGQVGLGPSDIATARLQSAAEIDLSVDGIVEPGQTTSVTVSVANVGAGHYLPTGLTDFRQMWLSVTAKTATGEEIKLGERRFGTVFQDDKGNAPVQMWEATGKKSDDRIPPRQSITETYELTMPDEKVVEVKAALYYQSASDEFAKKAGVENPTTTMASATSSVYPSDEARKASVLEANQGRSSMGGGIMLTLVVSGVIAAFVAVVLIMLNVRGRSQN